MAFTAKVMVDRLCDGDPTRLKRLAVRFSRPVFPGDTITTKVWPNGDRAEPARLALMPMKPVIADGLAVIRDGSPVA